MVALKTFQKQRRGVLLLVVLSMLTLFMMLGVSYIVVATRARKAARAFANNVVAATTAGVTDQTLLDQAFMIVVRGSQEPLNNANQPTPLGSGGGECLLGDKYGSAIAGATSTTTIIGKVGSATAGLPNGSAGNAFFSISTAGLSPSPANASDLVGRALTFSLPGLSASTRIIQATGLAAAPSLVVAAGPTVSGRQLSAAIVTNAINSVTSGSATIVINGREFAGTNGDTNEPWDGIDSRNPLFAKVVSEDANNNGTLDAGEDKNRNGVIDTYLDGTASFGGSSALPLVDNDSDGIADSRFLDIGLPPVVSPSGAVLYPRAAFLVADLDGRLNLNVHGSGAEEATFDLGKNRDMYPPLMLVGGGTAVPLYQLPRGYGIGPADISVDRSLVLGKNPGSVQQRILNAAATTSGSPATNGAPQDAATLRYLPLVPPTEGRYGDGVGGASGVGPTATTARPGVAGTNDLVSVSLDQWRCSLTSGAAQSFFAAPGRFGSPPDFRGLFKIWVDDSGQPVYYRPFWTGDPDSLAVSAGVGNEAIDDPYEVNLNRAAVRGGLRNPTATTVEPADSLFAVPELEGLLRFGDPDTMRLPRRLVALTGTEASRSRLAVTTESWDTPAIVGDAWQQVINTQFSGFINTSGLLSPKRPQDLFSPEILQGHRMDLNRPFHDVGNYDEPNDATGTARRQAFARQLYCLLAAIAQKNGATWNTKTAEQIAQYAINVVDFRDADSVMTQFKYDPTFSPSNTTWSPGTNDYVWGCERPEILITETWAWHNRRTDDTSTANSSYVMPTASADNDFDQQSRPQGAFFVELFSPWTSTAKRYASASGATANVMDASKTDEILRAEPLPEEFADDEDANGNGSLDTGEDRNGNGVLDMRRWHDSAINLSGTNSSGAPFWRLVTVRGTNAFGTDPVVPATTNATLSILDPARPGATVPVDRAFYFVKPTDAIIAATGSSATFWQQTPGGKCPNISTYVVVGTDAPFNPLISGTAAADVRVMKGAYGQFATITEPLTNTADPYDTMAQAVGANPYTAPATGNGNVGTWSSPLDEPLDADTTPPAGITSKPFLSGGKPLLMINGTHDNFAVVHLQRLANPTQAWNATTNPYLTVDSMTVDLTVVNTDKDGVNYDEPGTTGAAPLGYLETQKKYGTGSTATQAASTQRGGRLAELTGGVKPTHNIWSAVVTGTSPKISATAADAASYRTDAPVPRPATQPTPDVPNSKPNPCVALASSSHTLKSAPERFYDSGAAKTYPFAWLFWPNRPFTSAFELAYVPATSPFTLLRWHTLGTGLPRPFAHLPGYFETSTPQAPWDAIAGRSSTKGASDRSLWHFLHVPTPFAGIYATAPGSANSAALADLGLDIFPVNSLSRFREPGRINVNTITDRRVWRGLFGAVTDRNDTPDPTAAEPACETIPGWKSGMFVILTGTTPRANVVEFMRSIPKPGRDNVPNPLSPGGFLDQHVNEDRNGNGMLDPSEDVNDNGVLDTGEDTNGNGVLDPSEDDNGNGTLDKNDYRDTERHVYFRYQTMNRLANLVTTRSNVFAIWITIGYFDDSVVSVEAEPVRRHRAFYIVDRSIPVGYEPGVNHNVSDAVLLRRIIQ